MITHRNFMAIYSSYTSSLFIKYALEKIDIEEWCFLLIEDITDFSNKYITEENNIINEDITNFLEYWKLYVATRFSEKKAIKTRSFENPLYRIKYYNDTFFKNDKYSVNLNNLIGSSGYLALIMAYDCLLDCDGKYEKLVYYSMLNIGDTDTIGAIASGWYGAYYGMGDVPLKQLKYIETEKEIKNLSIKLEKKYGKI